MTRFALTVIICALCAPVLAAGKLSKEEDCGYQADVVDAVLKARMERVKEEDVAKVIAAAQPQWPENYNNTIPLLTAHIYSLKRRDLKNVDLGAKWKEACLAAK